MEDFAVGDAPKAAAQMPALIYFVQQFGIAATLLAQESLLPLPG
jgi:hypothetical protein